MKRLAVVLVLACATAAAAEPRRDPFMFGSASGSTSEAAGVPGPILIGVLWDAAQPLAVFGEEPVPAGHEVAGWRIAEITPNGVVVERGGQRVSLEPGQTIPPQ